MFRSMTLLVLILCYERPEIVTKAALETTTVPLGHSNGPNAAHLSLNRSPKGKGFVARQAGSFPIPPGRRWQSPLSFTSSR
jgi:hypothetical protein